MNAAPPDKVNITDITVKLKTKPNIPKHHLYLSFSISCRSSAMSSFERMPSL